MSKQSFTLLFILFPLSLIIISFWGSPNTKAIFHTVIPTSLKILSIIPSKYSIARSDIIYISSNIYSISISLASLKLIIIFIFTFKYSFVSNCYSFTMFSTLLINFSKIHLIITLLNTKSWFFYKLPQIKVHVNLLIVFQVFQILLLIWYSEQSIFWFNFAITFT